MSALLIVTEHGKPVRFLSDPAGLRTATADEAGAYDLLKSSAKLIDADEWDKAAAQIDEAAGIMGETFPDVVSLRTMLHFLRTEEDGAR